MVSAVGGKAIDEEELAAGYGKAVGGVVGNEGGSVAKHDLETHPFAGDGDGLASADLLPSEYFERVSLDRFEEIGLAGVSAVVTPGNEWRRGGCQDITLYIGSSVSGLCDEVGEDLIGSDRRDRLNEQRESLLHERKVLEGDAGLAECDVGDIKSFVLDDLRYETVEICRRLRVVHQNLTIHQSKLGGLRGEGV